MSYIEDVEALFVGIVRRGLALRTADCAIVEDWERRGVPLEVVRRGLENGVKRFLESADPHAPLPSVLKYYRVHVEKEFDASRRALAQGVLPVRPPAPIPPTRDLAAEALALLEARRRQAPSRLLDDAIARIRTTAHGGALVSELAAIDDELARAAIAGSPALVERVNRLVRAAAARGLGNAAVADIRRAETRAAAAELGVPSLVEMLLTSGG
ncbi:MAG: hypothetical protein FJ087_08890 [Deltaproteobacteria bacterium]|nr:hypothetical protein [Deltaproteobacteria bacterium]